MIRKTVIWAFSVLVGGSVIIGLFLFMSNLINVEQTIQEDQVDHKTFLISDINRQCDKHIEDLLVMVSVSQACEVDDDCDVVDFRYGYKNRASCPFPVQRGKADLVSAAISKISSCVQRYCRDVPLRHGNALLASCQNNICTSEYVPPISPGRLIDQTMDSIDESQVDKDASVDS